jgi:hypothetical protein
MENVRGLGFDRNEAILQEGLDLVQPRYRILGPLLLDAADFGAATSHSVLAPALTNDLELQLRKRCIGRPPKVRPSCGPFRCWMARRPQVLHAAARETQILLMGG